MLLSRSGGTAKRPLRWALLILRQLRRLEEYDAMPAARHRHSLLVLGAWVLGIALVLTALSLVGLRP